MPDYTDYADRTNKVLAPVVGTGQPQSYLIVANSTAPNQVLVAGAPVAWQFGVSQGGPFLSVGAGAWYPIRLTQQYTTVWLVVPQGAVLSIAENEVLAAQGPPGAPGTGSSEQQAYSDYQGEIYGGEALAVSPYGGVTLAQADDLDYRCIGFASGMAAQGDAVSIVTSGSLVLSSWSGVAGAPTLSSGALYFLDAANPGRITTTAPTAVGTFAQQVGSGFGPQTLLVQVSAPIMN